MKTIRRQAPGASSGQKHQRRFAGVWRLEPGARSGLSLIEIIFVVAIMGLLSVMLASAFSKFNSTQTLQTGSLSAASVFDRARAESVAGVDGQPHGVHMASTTLTLFEGSTYSAGSSANQSFPLMGNLVIIQTQLASGTVDVIFDQLTGTTAESGTTTLQVGSDSSRRKVITVSSVGTVNVQ